MRSWNGDLSYSKSFIFDLHQIYIKGEILHYVHIFMKFYLAIVKILLTTLLLSYINTQQPPNQLNAYLITPDSTVKMITNNLPNSSFIQVENFFDCSLSSIYSYTQTNTQYQDNTPYSIAFTGIIQNTSFTFSTIHNNFDLSY
jgi:hypothetical protein